MSSTSWRLWAVPNSYSTRPPPTGICPGPILIASATSWGWTFWRDTAMFSPPLAAPLEVAPGRVDVGQLGVPDRLADVDDQGVDVLVVEAGLAPLDGRALVVLPGHPAGAQHPVDGGRPADVVERRHPRVVAGPGRVGAVTGGAGVLVQLAAAGVHGLAVGRLLLGGGAGRGHPGRPP